MNWVGVYVWDWIIICMIWPKRMISDESMIYWHINNKIVQYPEMGGAYTIHFSMILNKEPRFVPIYCPFLNIRYQYISFFYQF